jgi:hypothetical protein
VPYIIQDFRSHSKSIVESGKKVFIPRKNQLYCYIYFKFSVADHVFSNILTVYSGVASGHAFPQISLLKQCFIYVKALKIHNYHIVILCNYIIVIHNIHIV